MTRYVRLVAVLAALAFPTIALAQGVVRFQSITNGGIVIGSGGSSSTVLDAANIGSFASVKVQTIDTYTGTWVVRCSVGTTDDFDTTNPLKLVKQGDSTEVASVSNEVGTWNVKGAAGCRYVGVFVTAGFAATDTLVWMRATQTDDGGTGGGSSGEITGEVEVTSGTLTAVTTITNPVTVTDGAGALNVIVDSSATLTVTSTNLDIQSGGTDLATSAQGAAIQTAAELLDNAVYTTTLASNIALTQDVLATAAFMYKYDSVSGNLDLFDGTVTVSGLPSVTDGVTFSPGSTLMTVAGCRQDNNSLSPGGAAGDGKIISLGCGEFGNGWMSLVDPESGEPIVWADAAILDTTVYATGTTTAMIAGVVRSDVAGSLVGSTNDITALISDASGLLWTRSLDPCSGIAKTTTPFSITADTVVISATASKKTYICGLAVVASAAEIFSVTQGDTSTCGTNEVALVGSTTDANGLSFAANGGMTWGNGSSTVIAGSVTNDDICFNVSGSNRVSGSVIWVQAP